ncbi:MAG: PIN domain-containing protein [Deltaproteobacteria bacterium]|jgi:predicted nucleic acid-binding protein|nr:PIN domain-containing protein [Deltaproteobacteria bacterium]MCL5880627.1 PIN domain-containing protein [Deltaproteobacteria bacterium]MDA8305138.1 PIN domain-containing protein [Deltaproteobacteria bacterium]
MFKKVFIDANVILDIFDNSRSFSKYSIETISYLLTNSAQLFTSSDLITTVYYILSKKNKNIALKSIKLSLDYLDLIPFSNFETAKAIKLMEADKSYKDFEDTLQYVLAKKNKCEIILSNDNNFYGKDIEIATTEKFCKIYIKN